VATLDITLTAKPRPAYYALLDCGREIALTHGEDAAVEWAQHVLSRDFDLFVRVSTEKPKPKLRLIQGGR
jgi:hypothetical protein